MSNKPRKIDSLDVMAAMDIIGETLFLQGLTPGEVRKLLNQKIGGLK